MNVFTIVLIIVVSILLFTYFYNGYKRLKAYRKVKNVWPPLPVPRCPDYWTETGNNCVNGFNLGTGVNNKNPVQTIDLLGSTVDIYNN